MITRRQAIKHTALATATVAIAPSVIGQTAGTTPTPFTLPALPYAYDALEPHIDARTMEIHHDKHHAGYVSNLNKAVADVNLKGNLTIETLLKDLSTLPEASRTAIRNNGGGHYNHSLFWQTMKKNGGGEPRGDLSKAIDSSFGSFNAFKETFAKAAASRFGSGWAWLVLSDGKLLVESSPNQDCPLSNGKQPLLGLDVWEHAYYLKYQNKRTDYIAAWWNVVNWDFVAERHAKLRG